MVLTTDAADQKAYPEDPYCLAVRPVYGGKFYEVFMFNGGRLPNKFVTARYTTEGEAKHAILTHYNKKERERLFRPNGRPRFFPRPTQGRKSGYKMNKVKNNDGASKASSPV